MSANAVTPECESCGADDAWHDYTFGMFLCGPCNRRFGHAEWLRQRAALQARKVQLRARTDAPRGLSA